MKIAELMNYKYGLPFSNNFLQFERHVIHSLTHSITHKLVGKDNNNDYYNNNSNNLCMIRRLLKGLVALIGIGGIVKILATDSDNDRDGVRNCCQGSSSLLESEFQLLWAISCDPVGLS